MAGNTVTILLVEDDPVDVEAIHRALRKVKVANPLFVASDGLEALEMLRGSSGKGPIPRPYLILLDLNMPRMNGLELLKVIRADEALSRSIIFILTTSKHDEDRVAAYGLNVAGYVVKSNVADGFISLFNMLDHYWRIVEFP